MSARLVADLKAAKATDHAHALVYNTVRLNQPTTHRLISTHKTEAEASRAMRDRSTRSIPWMNCCVS
jgi:hypothetical protein